jgi:pimeloyl-ACP methyl ester carboxylesterase
MFLQENAGNMSHRLPFLRALALNLRVPIFAPSYRGYGQSEGKPTERGIAADARAFLEHLAERQDVDGSRVVVFGRSLGGAVAIHLAAELQRDEEEEHEEQAAEGQRAAGSRQKRRLPPLAALLVENTFTSVEDMVGRVVPPLGALMGTGYEAIVREAEQQRSADADADAAAAARPSPARRPNLRGKPLNPLVTNKWRNLEAVRRVPERVPVLLMASVNDEMIPFPQMQALHHEIKHSRRRRGGGGGEGAAADPTAEAAAARSAAAAAALARAEGRAAPAREGKNEGEGAGASGEGAPKPQQARGRPPPAPVVWQEWARSGHMDAYDTEPVLYWQTLRDFMDAHVHGSGARR